MPPLLIKKRVKASTEMQNKDQHGMRVFFALWPELAVRGVRSVRESQVVQRSRWLAVNCGSNLSLSPISREIYSSRNMTGTVMTKG